MRLAKAKLILEQISGDEDQLVASTTSLLLQQQQRQGSTSEAATKSTARRQSPSRAPRVSRRRGPRGLSGEQPQPEEDAVVIPDNLWSNGHLLDGGGSNTVTRWARGKKVAEPLVKYDPVAAEAKLWRQSNRWVIRNFQIAVPIGYWAVLVVADYLSGQSKSNRRIRAVQLRSAISDLGPAIIKGGQALASRPDLMPSEYLEELQKLQDDVPRFSNTLAFQTVEEELGIHFEDVFELVEPEPIAAASIGQVYKARLKENGDLVALKIQRPKCEDVIALDLYVLRWWGGVYNQIFRLLNRDIDVQSIIDDFGELIYREIDYVAEASNAQRFNELYAGVRDVFVPKIYSDLTTSKVLTMEWVDGFRLTDAANLQKYNLDESKLVDTLVECSLRQILGKL
jgi:aarF domain-containing kinase